MPDRFEIEELRAVTIQNSEILDETVERINRLANTIERMQQEIEDLKKYNRRYTM
jgi:methyl-accepting chemotaxis protein